MGGDGVQTRERVEFGRVYACASVSEAPGGAAVIAGLGVAADEALELRAVVRDPGGAFGAPVALGDRPGIPSAAVGPAGDAVVAWAEHVSRRRFRIVAARREPGGAFGAPEALVDWRRDEDDTPVVDIRATVDTAGTATLVWRRELPSDDFDEHIEVATAARGGAFVTQRIGDGVSTSSAPVLATSPGGWALAAFQEAREGPPQVFERAPGGAFARVAVPETPDLRIRSGVAVAIRDGGGAVVAWRGGRSDVSGGVEAVTREAGGPFGAVRTVAEPPGRVHYGSSFVLDGLFDPLEPLGGPPFDGEDPSLRAALGSDGRIALAWTAVSGRPPLRTLVAHAATGRLAGTFEAPQTLGSPMRETSDVVPLFLADGRAAVTWTDNAHGPADGRFHVAVEGAPAPPAPTAPRLMLRAPRFQRLFASQSLRVTAGCDRACDLRTLVAGPRGYKGDARTSTRHLAGRGPLDAGSVDGVYRSRSRVVKIVVQATAPGGTATSMRRVRVRVARRPALPVQRPIDVTARRDGDEVVVRWRTAEPARRQYFFVAGYETRDDDAVETAGAFDFVNAPGRRRFRSRLRPPEGSDVRWVVLATASLDSNVDRVVVVRVR